MSCHAVVKAPARLNWHDCSNGKAVNRFCNMEALSFVFNAAFLTVKTCTELQLLLILCVGLPCYYANTLPTAQQWKQNSTMRLGCPGEPLQHRTTPWDGKKHPVAV